MKKKNLLTLALSLALVAVIAVGGTLAYLTSNSGTLTNNFTVGKGYGDNGFYLDETKKPTGDNPTEIKTDPADRTTTGNIYEPMTLGETLAKDPTFHLTDGPDSYVFAKVENVDELVAKGFIVSNETAPTDDTPSALNTTNWVKVANLPDGKGSDLDGYYRYKDIVSAGATMEPLFKSVRLKGNLTAMPQNVNINILIQGVAVQSANLTAETAWTEADKLI